MDQDDTAIGLGVPFLILIFLTWINTSGHIDSYPFFPWIYVSWGGLLIVIGCLLLIPVFILTIIFITSNGNTSESVAFGFAIPAWLLIISGTTIGIYYTSSSFLTPVLFFVFICPQIVLGSGLFARRNYSVSPMRQSTPSQFHNPYSQRQAIPNRPLSQPPNRSGTNMIPNEVRLASTYGQSIKRCVQCGNTLDVKTKVCFFCGATQAEERVMPPTYSMPPPQIPPVPTPPQRGREEFNFCPNCGARIRRGNMFCTQCGSSLE